MKARALALLACLGAGGCTALFGDSVEQDLSVAADLGVDMDLAVAVEDLRPPVDMTRVWEAHQLAASVLHDVWGAGTGAGSIVIAVGSAGTIFRSTDEGDTFSAVPSGVSAELRSVYGRAVNDIWIAGDGASTPSSGGGNLAMFLHGDGSAFTRDLNTLFNVSIQQLWSAGPGEKVWGLGVCGAMSTDGSGTYVGENGYACDNIAGLWGSGTTDLWYQCGGLNYCLRRSTGVGFADVATVPPDKHLRYGLWGFGAPGTTSELWTVGEGTTVERFVPATAVWTTDLSRDAGVPLQAVWGSSPTDLWAVGGQSTVLHRTATGWEEESLPGAKVSVLSVWGMPSGRVIAVGEFGWVFVRR